jgi:hypothetical protein
MHMSKGTVSMFQILSKKAMSMKQILEQQQGCKYMSDLESDSSVFADFSMDRYACQVDDQFSNHFEHEVTDDCIDNYMFLVDHNQYVLNIVLSLSYDHYSEEGVVATDDQDLITRELEGYQFSSKEAFMDEVFMDQYVSDLGFKDPFAALMESYISDHLKISDFIYSSTLPGEYCFLKDFLSLLLYFSYYLLISDRDKIISVLKLLEWLLWKSSFT